MGKTFECSTQVNLDHIVNLVTLFKSSAYSSAAHNLTHQGILEVIERMWAMDYDYMRIDNTDGNLCASYPQTIFVPNRCMTTPLRQAGVRTFTASERTHNEDVHDLVPDYCDMPHDFAISGLLSMHEGVEDESPLKFDGIDASDTESRSKELVKLIEASKYGRSRNRFVVPVILYNGKYIARSSTVPLAMEVMARMGIDILSSAVTNVYKSLSTFTLPTLSFLQETSGIEESVVNENLAFFTAHKAADAALLKKCKISTIFDLMVEEQKVKFYLYCSSSEKVKGETFYEDFTLNIVPYPGCEFFKSFTEHSYDATGLKFNWYASEINAELQLQEDLFPGCNTKAYKNWDLRRLTRRYLQYMLTYMRSDSHDGMLVHCISGWDRTPLFVSLLRLSLWADGVVHQSLDAAQMLYFTLAYDWMFFGHQLPDREKKSEAIIVFCFYFLKYIKGEQFNVTSSLFGTSSELDKEDERLDEKDDDFEEITMEDVAEELATPDVSLLKDSDVSLQNSSVASSEFELQSPKGPSPLRPGHSMQADLAKRGESSPFDDRGKHMAGLEGTAVADESRKAFPRYRRLTELRKLYFDQLKVTIKRHKEDSSFIYKLVPALKTYATISEQEGL